MVTLGTENVHPPAHKRGPAGGFIISSFGGKLRRADERQSMYQWTGTIAQHSVEICLVNRHQPCDHRHVCSRWSDARTLRTFEKQFETGVPTQCRELLG